MQLASAIFNLLQALHLMQIGDSMRRVCYLANWAQYRTTPTRLNAESLGKLIDPHLCSHIVVAFLDVKDGLMQMREWNDGELIDSLLELKQINADLKVMVAIGGWNAGTQPFSFIMSSDESIRRFNSEAIRFLRQNNLDGLDIDMEYPGGRGSPPEDRERFTKWMQMLASDFENEATRTRRPKLILSAAVGVAKKVVDAGYEVQKLNEAFDFITLMTYDFHGAWENKTGHNAPIRFESTSDDEERHQFTADWSVNYWLDQGSIPRKLNLGIPAYGRSFTLCPNVTEFGVNAPACGAGPAGVWTKEAGVNAYFETCLKEQCQDSYETLQDPMSETPYMYRKDNIEWISTEDVDSVTAKARFALERQLGGIALWTLDFDDWADLCGHGEQPLLRAINKALDIADARPERHHRRGKRLQAATSGFINPC